MSIKIRFSILFNFYFLSLSQILSQNAYSVGPEKLAHSFFHGSAVFHQSAVLRGVCPTVTHMRSLSNLPQLLNRSLLTRDLTVEGPNQDGKIYLKGTRKEVLEKSVHDLQEWKKKFKEVIPGATLPFTQEDGLYSVEITPILPSKILEPLQRRKSFWSGPSCWNTALWTYNLQNNIRYTSDREFTFCLESYCKPVLEDEKQVGDIGAVRLSHSERHGFIFLGNLIFQKQGFGKHMHWEIIPYHRFIEAYSGINFHPEIEIDYFRPPASGEVSNLTTIPELKQIESEISELMGTHTRPTSSTSPTKGIISWNRLLVLKEQLFKLSQSELSESDHYTVSSLIDQINIIVDDL